MKIAVFIILALLELGTSVTFDKKIQKTLSEKKSNLRSAAQNKSKSQGKAKVNNNFQEISQNSKDDNDIASLRQNFIQKTRLMRSKAKAGKDGFKSTDNDVLGVEIKDKKELCRDAPGAEGKKDDKYKNLQANDTRFSDGDAAYFYDVVSPLFEKAYAEEASANFKAFQDKNSEAKPDADKKDAQKSMRFKQTQDAAKNNPTTAEQEPEGPYINLGGLKTGMSEFKWGNTDLTAEDYMSIYTKENDRDRLYLREFMFFENEFISKRVGDEACEQCLEKVRASIKELFDHADCSQSGQITAEQLYNALNNFKEDPKNIKVTTSMVNAFVLKVMEVNTATVNLKEFTYGILCGYMERLFEPSGKPKIVEVEKMMDYRKKRVDLGNGPR